jgi:hypothetical protein
MASARIWSAQYQRMFGRRCTGMGGDAPCRVVAAPGW